MAINQKLLLAKAFYFFQCGAWACLIPFYPVYFKSLGFSLPHIGILGCVRPFVAFLAAPLWCSFSDIWGKRYEHSHKTILMICLVVSALLRMFLISTSSFFDAFVKLFIAEFVGAAVQPLTDSMVFEMLADKPYNYGKQRLWGAVGWGLAALGIGPIVDKLNQDYFFYGHLVFTMLCLLVTVKFPRCRQARKPFWHNIRKLMTWPIIMFLIIVYVMGTVVGVIQYYLLVFLKSLGGSHTLMGISMTVTCSSEVPLFFISGWMIKKLGVHSLLYTAMFCAALRLVYYSFLKDPWLVLPVELLHGVTFASMWTAAVSYAQFIAPPGYGASTQGILSSVYYGLGLGSGALFGGFIQDEWSYRVLFRVGASTSIIALILFSILHVLTKLNSPKEIVKPEDSKLPEVIDVSDHDMERIALTLNNNEHDIQDISSSYSPLVDDAK